MGLVLECLQKIVIFSIFFKDFKMVICETKTIIIRLFVKSSMYFINIISSKTKKWMSRKSTKEI